ncbi:MAG TPA: response regulator [Phycisphaeraceae bacterium]|nr:response regulator [Phycisphaeraceae bacterium]
MRREKDVLTTGEVAKICNVAPRTVSKWFDSGALRGYRIPGSKDRRIPINSLIRFMKAHNIPLDGLTSGNTRVLIIDDEKEVVDTLKQLLTEQTSYEVHAANGSFAAGLECEKFRPHVMLLDLHIGDGDGKAICDMVRENDDLQFTRVIAMSGKLTEGQAAQLRSQGFDGFLKKPFTIRQVVDEIEKVSSLVY